MCSRSTVRAMIRIATAALLALSVAASGCGPKTLYDPRAGVLTRSDEAFVLPIGALDRARWQLEVPGLADAPERYSFDYEAVLYRIRTGGPMQRPESIVVLSVHEYPEAIRDAPSIVDRNERLAKQLKAWLTRQGLDNLAATPDRFVFDGRMLAVTEKDSDEPLEEPTVGAAFLFGTEYVLQAAYEIYPPASGEVMSAKEHQEALSAIAALLGRAQVK